MRIYFIAFTFVHDYGPCVGTLSMCKIQDFFNNSVLFAEFALLNAAWRSNNKFYLPFDLSARIPSVQHSDSQRKQSI